MILTEFVNEFNIPTFHFGNIKTRKNYLMNSCLIPGKFKGGNDFG